MDCSLPVSSVHGILQARILEWVAISFSRGSSSHRDWTHFSCIGRQILYLLSHLENSHTTTLKKKKKTGSSFSNWSYNDRKLPCPVRNKEKNFRLWTERIFKKIKKGNLSWESLKLCDNYNNSLQVNFWQWQSSLGNDGSASCHLGNDADNGAWPGLPATEVAQQKLRGLPQAAV